jgi:hypothetical protein
VRIAAALLVTAACCLPCSLGCTSIDPGDNYVVPLEEFNANYFYCVIEPKLIFAKKCGDNGSGGCHYSGKIPQMALVEHPPIACAGGVPTDMTQIGEGTPAQDNFVAVSGEMSMTYTSAPIYIYPTSGPPTHPVQVFTPMDPVVQYIIEWSQQ